MAKVADTEASVYYRIVKALPPHQFAGLYAVEEVYVKGSEIYRAEIVHEWDLRAFSEAALARFGGGAAYKAFVENNHVKDLTKANRKVEEPRAKVTEADVKNDMKLKGE